ncbi:hypothetical protein GCM10012275_07480 [Longimycelium tulufanense]|uniref:Uncharacterized protein n=1 Tax=Longimycelium tulufanense TaxID=907463 RepID=A0A8J3FUW9_9PSEU|nr:hypothetical protein [Longimycelium tulufanense]GGM39060.1 hypothetical protein GCM10012275_07480 [Longimycelium tulufanense]
MRREGHSYLWGKVVNNAGRRTSGTVTAPNRHALPVENATRITAHVLTGQVPPAGYRTPTLLLGGGLLQELPGIHVRIDEHAAGRGE